MYIEISSTIYLRKYDVTYRKCLIRLGYMNNILTNFTNKVFSYRWFAVKCNFDCTGKLEFILVLQEKSFTKAALFLFLRGAAGAIPLWLYNPMVWKRWLLSFAFVLWITLSVNYIFINTLNRYSQGIIGQG